MVGRKIKNNCYFYLINSLAVSKWTIPSIAVFILIFLLSFRLLSDPDLGFHLKAGKWMVENLAIPHHDISTYTVSNHEYIDLHWFFQVFIYLFYLATGYPGLSLLVTLLSLTLLCLLLLRNHMFRIPLYLSCILVFWGYLIMEPRIMLRPEMLTFLYICIALIILDLYYYTRRNLLFFLPVIMLLWCNTQGLFILGFVLTGSYFISLYVRDRRIDRVYFLWMMISILICLCNPYFFKGFSFPLELFTRFKHENIFNQHIKEFSSLSQLGLSSPKEILFLPFAFLSILASLITFRKRKPHEFILLAVFLYLSLLAIRNIPLFIIIAFPIASLAFSEITEKIRHKSILFKWKHFKVIQGFIILLFTVVPLGIACRICTNAYYVSNQSYNKTGMGLDTEQQAVSVASFLVKNRIEGRIVNSLSFGGWLSWSIPQPIFMDARLEVIQESLYREIYDSWNGGLQQIINKYNPDLFVYNYQVYYPWTLQLSQLKNWRLIYLDGIAAVYAREGTPATLNTFTANDVLSRDHIQEDVSDKDISTILSLKPGSKIKHWLSGFYTKNDDDVKRLVNMGSFYFQIKEYDAAEKLFLQAFKRSNGEVTSVFYALADIYRIKNDPEKFKICCIQILANDPKNPISGDTLSGDITSAAVSIRQSDSIKLRNDAIIYFNTGNQKYQQGDIPGAMADLEKAIRLNPGYYKAYNNRGIIRAFSLKQLKEAIRDFDTAIILKPDYADAYLGRGSVKFQMNDPEGACKDWRRSAASGNTQASKLLEIHCSGR